jgi:hypothetical protein
LPLAIGVRTASAITAVFVMASPLEFMGTSS